MKLLVVSHPCVTAVNQALFGDVARLSGWTVDLLVPASWNSEYARNVQPSRWEGFEGQIHRCPVWGSGNIPLHFYKSFLTRMMRKVDPDLIYVHHEPYGLATAQIYLANSLTRSVPIGFYAAQNIMKRYPVPFRWFESMVFRSSDFSFPVTQGALEMLRQKGYEGSAEVLPLALDEKVYHPRPGWAQDQRKKLDIASDTFCFGYLGRFVEEKGLLTLIRAAATLPKGNWRCLFVGGGPLEEVMHRELAASGLTEHVRFYGVVPHEEVPGWLSLFDVLMLPSETRNNWKEQFGRVIVEANACETAVIGTDCGEIANVLSSTGGGTLVQEANAAALAGAMNEMLTNPEKARQLGVTGARSARECYGQERVASQFIQALDRATSAQTATRSSKRGC